MWAVGALAWELLTGRPLFGDSFSDEDVMMALLGFKPLPFEADPSLWVLFTESQVISFHAQPHERPMQRDYVPIASRGLLCCPEEIMCPALNHDVVGALISPWIGSC